MKMNNIFRRGGGGVDDGRGRLRRPPYPVDETIREHAGGSGRRKRPLPTQLSPYGMAAALVMACVVLASLLYLLLPAGAARADGGAPNLAYISGTTKGISVVDIQQKAVTNNFSITGDPQTIYLSLDGRFLYIAQPTLGRVTLLAAKTGQTVCTANVPGQPTLLAFDAGLNILYAAGNKANTIAEIDPNNCSIKKTLTTNGDVYGNAATGGHLAALLGTDEKYLKAHKLSLKDLKGVVPISGVFR